MPNWVRKLTFGKKEHKKFSENVDPAFSRCRTRSKLLVLYNSHLAWDILKSPLTSRALRLLFRLSVDAEAFISFSAKARSVFCEPGRLLIHWTAVERMLNFDFEENDFRGVKALTRPWDDLDFGLRRLAALCIRDNDVDCGTSFRMISSFSSWGSDANFNFRMFFFRLLLTTNVPSCRYFANSSFSNVVISQEMAVYWLKADRFRKLRSELSSSSICSCIFVCSMKWFLFAIRKRKKEKEITKELRMFASFPIWLELIGFMIREFRKKWNFLERWKAGNAISAGKGSKHSRFGMPLRISSISPAVNAPR